MTSLWQVDERKSRVEMRSPVRNLWQHSRKKEMKGTWAVSGQGGEKSLEPQCALKAEPIGLSHRSDWGLGERERKEN